MTQNQTGTGTIAGYFEDNEDARRAVEALHEADFTSAHIGVAHRGASSSSSTAPASSSTSHTHAGEKATSTWEKIKQLFQGNEAEPYADERTQGDLANREITENPGDNARYSNQRAEGTQDIRDNRDDWDKQSSRYDPSDLDQSFTSLNIPEDRARYFSHRFAGSQRGAVVTVNAGDRVAEAESILTRYGADLGQNTGNYDYSERTRGNETESNREGVQNNIQLLGEVLRVHKDRVSRGEVRVRKEVVVETQTVQVPVTREELVIERHPVDQTTPATGTIGESEVRIPLSEERASVDTSTIVREEVALGKKPVSEVRDLTGEVRREELVVEDPTKRSA